jgi:hypothetical protein
MEEAQEENIWYANAPEPRCEVLKKNKATWVSIWSHGQPQFTPLVGYVKYPEMATRLCDSCMQISSTRFRP